MVKWLYSLQRNCIYVGEFFILGSQGGSLCLYALRKLCEEHTKKKHKQNYSETGGKKKCIPGTKRAMCPEQVKKEKSRWDDIE